MQTNVKQRIDELVDLLNKWSEHYYTKNTSLVSDQVYDAHLQELKMLEKSHPSLIRLDSPTRLVGYNVQGTKFAKIKHIKKRLSLNNAFSENDLNSFFVTIDKKVQGSIKYCCEYKIDGISLAITYKNGKLFQALTRGDGIIGEDVTHTARVIKNIPLQIPIKETISIRGEVYFPLTEFLKRNNELKKVKKTVYMNPRNAVSGLLRQISIKNMAKAKLNISFYDLVQYKDFKLKTQEDLFLFFKQNKIPYLDNYQISDAKNVYSTIEKMIKEKSALNLEIDGIVIKINDFQKRETIGVTSKFPKWAIAYKLPQKKVETKLKRIFITIGRTGRVTYNAELDPVYLNGTIVKFATLHNYEWIEKKDIRVNDRVLVHKAGYIIPEILAVNKNARGKESLKFERITICPYCKSHLVSLKDEVDQYCVNKECEEIILRKLTHFVSRDALQISSISEEIIRKLYHKGWLKRIEDFFILHFYFPQWIKEKGFQKKSVHNILGAFRKAFNNVDLDRLLFALGIKHLGKTTSKKLVDHFQSFNAIANASLQDLESIRDVGTIVAKEVYTFFHSKDNLQLINKIELFFNLNKTPIKKTSLLKNSKFVITGSLTKPREYFTKLIMDNGGWVTSTISKKTTYLLVGENPGSKLTKAKKLGIRIIKEKDFYHLLKK